MYAMDIGRRFLALYNRKMGVELSAYQFFEEVMWPLFFNSADNKQLMTLYNSDFFQPYEKLALKENMLIQDFRLKKFKETLSAINAGERTISGGNTPGFPAAENEATTSGMVSSFELAFNSNETLYAWIGMSLSISVGNGIDVLIADDDLNWYIYEGWQFYRKHINENSQFIGRQISKWNQLWLIEGSKYLDSTTPDIYAHIKHLIKLKPINENLNLDTDYNWPQNLQALGILMNKNSQKDSVSGYGFSLGQTNLTLGFFNISLQAIPFLNAVWQKIAPEYEGGIPLKEFKTRFTARTAIIEGGFNLRTLEPEEIKKILDTNEPKKILSNSKSILIYKSWLSSMLNNEELWQAAASNAHIFQKIDKIKGINLDTNIMEILNASSKLKFMNELINLIEKKKDDSFEAELLTMAKQINHHIPADQFTYFRLLMKLNFLVAEQAS